MDKLDDIRKIIRSKPISCPENCPFNTESIYLQGVCTLFDELILTYERLPECINEFRFKTEDE